MSYLKLILRAVRVDTNTNRAYEIHLDKGLFETWVVTTANGRYGAGKGSQRNYSFDNLSDAQVFIHKILKKRDNSQNRIGCPYELIQSQGTLKSVFCSFST